MGGRVVKDMYFSVNTIRFYGWLGSSRAVYSFSCFWAEKLGNASKGLDKDNISCLFL